MDNKSNIAKAFSEKLNKMELQPDESVWKNVSSRIPQSSPSWFAKKGLWAGGAVVLVAVAIYLGSVLLPQNQKIAEVDSHQSPETEVLTAPIVSDENPQNKITSQEIPNENSVIVDPTDTDKSDSDKTSENQNNSVIASSDVVKNTTPQIPDNTESSELKNPEKNQKPISITENSSSVKTTYQVAEIQDPVVLRDSTIKFSVNPTICKGEKTKLSVDGGMYYLWSNGQSLPYIEVAPLMNSTYNVTVTDKFNYNHIHSYVVTIDEECTALVIPNAFSPNGDGNNDIFKPEGVNISEFMMQILSRDGRMLFITNDVNKGWDGTVNGQPLTSQVFIYNIVYKNGRGEQQIRQGQVTLIR